MNKKLINVISSGNIVIPLYLLKIYKDLKLELNEFIFLMYLYSKGNNMPLNPKLYSDELGISQKDVLLLIDSLSTKHMIEDKVIKNDKNINEEVISLDLFYEKYSLLLMDSLNNNDNTDSDIYDFIQKEFGRMLGPTEYEVIKAWIDDGNSEDIIKEAVKEAVISGVSNLRYIDKILLEWRKKGIKTASDVQKNRKAYRKKEEEADDAVLDLDWLDDDEE